VGNRRLVLGNRLLLTEVFGYESKLEGYGVGIAEEEEGKERLGDDGCNRLTSSSRLPERGSHNRDVCRADNLSPH
jgi:hypothetical protein